MTIYELLNSTLEERKIFYANSSDDELKLLYNELPFYEDHINYNRVKIEIELFYNFSIKPIKVQANF